MATQRSVQITQLEIGTNLDTVLSTLDTALTTAMNAIITTPPTGYQVGSIALDAGSPRAVWDGTNWNAWRSFTYNTIV